MKKLFLSVALLFLLMTGSANAATVGGYTFADNAFADLLLGYTGTYTNNSTIGTLSAAQLASVLTDSSAGTYAYLSGGGSTSYVELGFSDNYLVNGAGYDLALFDLGVDATFPVAVSVGGTIKYYYTADTGQDVTTPEGVSYNLNVALINLDDFGLASGTLLSSIVVYMGIGTLQPSLSIAGALNSANVGVPEPATMILFGLGLAGLAAIRRRMKR